MRNIILIGTIILATIDSIYALNPVYSAQATADFNPANFGNKAQNGNNGNGNNQNNNSGNNNGYNNNGNSTLNNNRSAPANTNGNNGYYSGNASVPNQNNNGAYNSNNNGQGNTGNNNWSNNVNNNQGNNNQNNGSYNNSQQNVFTENYALKGKQFSAKVFRKNDNNQLIRTELNSDNLQRAIVIFFGDWCPHCSRFLRNFSRNIPALTQSGVKIIFIGVPSVARLQKWSDPTDADYNENLQKLNDFGIQLGNNVELVLLGNSGSLGSNSVDSLPTMMAISYGKECFRGGADNSIERAEFNNNDEVNQFLQVFNAFGNNNNFGSNVRLITTSGNHGNKSSRPTYYTQKNSYGVNVAKANMYTDLLNDGCIMSCSRKIWTPPVSNTYNYSRSMCPPCPSCPVCPRCATPVSNSAYLQAEGIAEGTIVQLSPANVPEKCTTCGCILHRAFSKKCYNKPRKKVCANKSREPICKKLKCCPRPRS